ncbi:MAG TPA: neutral/alkaline non-lysosomal ceramidase N-terminal domain-containing protein [Acidobacteriota bacterium]|nr:neutral/alkaline non-lysosomal ceramidase N-terminal domain-containing protein [Acidobacteriota bacterium]
MARIDTMSSERSVRILVAAAKRVVFIFLVGFVGLLGQGSPEVCWAASMQGELASGVFRVGTARAKITPEENGWMGGYSHRNRPAEGTAADLWMRVVAFEDSQGRRRVLVNADIHIFPRRMHKEIVSLCETRYGVREHELMLIATHNHSGPALPEGFDPYINWGLDEEQMRKIRSASDFIRDRILDSIGVALSNPLPARLSFRRGKASLGVNRRVLQADGSYDFGANPSGVSDPDLPVLTVESAEGEMRAVIFTYACHCTSIRNGQEGFYQYHPDLAGVAAEEIERRFEGSTALFVTGCAGDIDPQPQGGVPQAEKNGRSLAEAVIATIAEAGGHRVEGPIRAIYKEINLPLAPLPSRQKFLELSRSQSAYSRRHAERMLAQMDEGTLPSQVPYPIQIWRFGRDLTLVALAGEVCVDYALRLKRELGPGQVWPVAYANEVPCYIPSERILKEGGYEAGWDQTQGPGIPSGSGSTIFYGWPAPLASGVEERICSEVRNLAKQ